MLASEDKLRVSSKHSAVLWRDIFYKSKDWQRQIPGTNKQKKTHNFFAKKENLLYESLITKHMKKSLVTDDLALVAETCDSSI